MENIILIGAGNHVKSVVDSIENLGIYNIFGLIEREKNTGMKYKNYNIIGTDLDLQKIFEYGIKNAFVSIGFLGKGNIRELLYNTLTEIGYKIPIIIDKTAILAKDFSIGEGSYIGKGVVVNSEAKIGKMTIINTNSTIEHDCMIGNYTHIAPGSVICGGVKIGDHNFIGANATVVQNISIGNCNVVGAGSVVYKDLNNCFKVYGNPMRVIKKDE